MSTETIAKTILVAEDNPDDLALLRHAFTRSQSPHRLQFVSSGLEIIDYLEGNAPYQDRQSFPIPSVLFLDMVMPQGGGINVLRWLASHPCFRHLPVVVLAGSNEQATLALGLGAKDFFLKPTATSDYLALLQGITDRWLYQPHQGAS